MMDLEALQRLTDIEEIKKLKARYFRLMDVDEDWVTWGDVLADDARIEIPERDEILSKDEFIDRVRKNHETALAPSVHQGSMPEIEITGPDTAHGTWAMFDYLDRPDGDGRVVLRGYGHYEEDYRKVDGSWKISFLRLTRLRVDQTITRLRTP